MPDRDQRLKSAVADHDAGRLAEAERGYRGLLDDRPDDAEAMHLLGVLLHQSGRNDQALELIRRSLELDGSRPNVHSNLASVLGRTGHAAESLHHLREALRLAPNLPEAHNNLGVTLEGMNRPKEAEPAYRKAIELRPTYAEAHHHLGNALRKQGRMDEAAAAHRHAVSLRPAYADALAALGNVLMEQGLSEEGVDCLRRAAELAPSPAAGSALLYTMHYLTGRHAPEISAAHFAWAARHAEPLGRDVRPHDNDRDPQRRLRVGYVSPDFRDHTVPRFFEPALDRRDRARFEVICYSDTHTPDATTRRLQPKADIWRETRGMPHDRLANLVRQDRIDVLVDLRGHGGDNRMLLFALRPAPVQVSMVGYFNTTGQSAIGYRITDALQDPFGSTAAFHAESLVRLDAGCWCYRPDDACPPVSPLPAASTGRITFGSLNKLAKVSDPCARLWARVLEAVPGSRLVLAATGGEAGNHSARQRLQSLGIPGDRLELTDKAPSRAQYLGRFGAIDIALDPSPFCGITTTCDALWQGIPTVSLAGDTPVSRAGLSILTVAGLADWVAETPAEYVRIAAGAAADLPALIALRAKLRSQVAASPLTDAALHILQLEQAYLAMWRNWCAGGAIPSKS